MTKLEEITAKLRSDMRASKDGTLHVIADMDEAFSAKLQDILSGYKADSDARSAGLLDKETIPTPAELCLGFALYVLGQYENLHNTMKRPRVTGDGMESILLILSIGANRLIGQHLRDAGVGMSRTDEIRKALEECISSYKD